MSRRLRVALLVPPFVGHMNPMTALGRTLGTRGHDVAVISLADAAGRVRRAGLPLIEIGQRRFPAGEFDRRVGEIGGKTGPVVMREMLGVVLDHGRSAVEELPEILRRERFDGLVMDQFWYGAESVAEATGTPLALASAALHFHREPSIPLFFEDRPYDPSWFGCLRNAAASASNMLWGWPMAVFYMRHRRRLGVRFMRPSHLNEMPPSLVQVTQVPRCLDFPRRRLPDHFHYTGPWVDGGRAKADEAGRRGAGFPWDRLDGRPLIYASLGTLQNRVGDLYRIMAEACVGQPVQLVIALGREDAALPTLPGNPLVVGYAPQLELLARASLVITHAGLNTSLETARAGVPMVAIPIAHDQPGVAARLVHHGLARMIRLSELSSDRLREAVRDVLGDVGYARRAKAVAAEIARMDGPGRAAELIETAFAERRRVKT